MTGKKQSCNTHKSTPQAMLTCVFICSDRQAKSDEMVETRPLYIQKKKKLTPVVRLCKVIFQLNRTSHQQQEYCMCLTFCTLVVFAIACNIQLVFQFGYFHSLFKFSDTLPDSTVTVIDLLQYLQYSGIVVHMYMFI